MEKREKENRPIHPAGSCSINMCGDEDQITIAAHQIRNHWLVDHSIDSRVNLGQSAHCVYLHAQQKSL
jgi:hypothetical protein